ncbi:uncharacterized protein LOC134208368 [Armigeres subalbatus]|uniref:uncharacterized protein LOC134208368 n=1 Tax=Armigeres subalbatus TaxID=124917 RepID=UPI002ED2A2D2
MKNGSTNLALSCVLILVTVITVTKGSGLTYLDVLQRLSDARGDVRTSLRAIRKLAIESGLISRKDETSTPAPALSDQQPTESWIDPEESGESDEYFEDIEESDEDDATTPEGRKKGGGGGGSNNNIVVTGGGDGSHDLGALYEVSSEEGGHKGHKKKGKKHGKGHKKHKKHHKWRKHLRKAAPIALVILAMKAILLHFLLKKLVLATALSLLIGKKSLLISSIIALKLLFQQPHSNDKSESSKLEVVHIPIRKEIGFHKKIQLNKFKGPGKVKIKIQPKILSTQKPAHIFNSYNSLIKHTHQQMEDFGGKYIPLGYENNHFQNYDITTPTTYLDSIPEGTEDNYYDVNDLQYIRREGWDGWTGYNRGEVAAESNGYAADYEQRPSTEYSVSSSYDQPYSYNSHGNGAAFGESVSSNGNNGQWSSPSDYNQSNYKQRNLSLMKYRRKRSAVGGEAM